jgi:hypothetical protein
VRLVDERILMKLDANHKVGGDVGLTVLGEFFDDFHYAYDAGFFAVAGVEEGEVASVHVSHVVPSCETSVSSYFIQ